MLRFDHDRNPDWMQRFHESIGDLDSELLLNLQAPREDVDDAGDLGKADHFPVRNVSNVGLANERKEMMFAHRVKLDVLNQNDFARIGGEDRTVDYVFEILPVAVGYKLKGARRARWRPQQTFSRRILANRFEQSME